MILESYWCALVVSVEDVVADGFLNGTLMLAQGFLLSKCYG